VYDQAESWSFEWDARHGIRPHEAEEIFLNGPRWRRDKNSAAGDYFMDGRTDGGRALTIVVQLKTGRTVRAITGW
jgi:hypothetical protein